MLFIIWLLYTVIFTTYTVGSVNAKPVVKNVINFIMLVTFFNFKFNERNDLFFEERKKGQKLCEIYAQSWNLENSYQFAD